jgi:hypothetical protein
MPVDDAHAEQLVGDAAVPAVSFLSVRDVVNVFGGAEVFQGYFDVGSAMSGKEKLYHG